MDKVNTTQLRPCMFDKRPGLFHRWADVAEIVPPSNMVGGHGGGVVRAVVGIIELEDGKVVTAYPERITFLDTPCIMQQVPPTDKDLEGSKGYCYKDQEAEHILEKVRKRVVLTVSSIPAFAGTLNRNMVIDSLERLFINWDWGCD